MRATSCMRLHLPNPAGFSTARQAVNTAMPAGTHIKQQAAHLTVPWRARVRAWPWPWGAWVWAWGAWVWVWAWVCPSPQRKHLSRYQCSPRHRWHHNLPCIHRHRSSGHNITSRRKSHSRACSSSHRRAPALVPTLSPREALPPARLPDPATDASEPPCLAPLRQRGIGPQIGGRQ